MGLYIGSYKGYYIGTYIEIFSTAVRDSRSWVWRKSRRHWPQLTLSPDTTKGSILSGWISYVLAFKCVIKWSLKVELTWGIWTRTPPTECSSGRGILITTSGFESHFFVVSKEFLRPWSSKTSSSVTWKVMNNLKLLYNEKGIHISCSI